MSKEIIALRLILIKDEAVSLNFKLNDKGSLKLFQLSTKVPAIISPVGYSAAARHRLARSDG